MYGLPPLPILPASPPPPTTAELHEYMLSHPRAFEEVLSSVLEAYRLYRTTDPCGPEPYISPTAGARYRAVAVAQERGRGFDATQRAKATRVYIFSKSGKALWESRAAECDLAAPGVREGPGTPVPVCAPGYALTCSPDRAISYGFIGPSWLAYNKMVPQDPQLTLEENPPRICLDMASEEKLQNQRKFSMYIGGPAVFIAGSKLKGPFGLFIMGLGVACTVWHATAHKKVKEITGV